MGNVFAKKPRKATKADGTTSGTLATGLPSSAQVNNNSYKPSGDNSAADQKIVKALYDYYPLQTDDLGFRKGDRLIITDCSSDDWWLARHQETHASGYIPSNYVIDDNNSPESQDWWFSIDRREANKQLMLPGNPVGTFLVRNATDGKTFALSIRVRDAHTGDFTIKHYRIRKGANGVVFITDKRIFPSLCELIDHYMEEMDGLCCKLTTPCPKESELVPFKKLEVKRSEIQMGKKLGAGQFGEVYAAKWQRSVDVAVKTLKPGSMTAEQFLKEAEIMHKLRHRKLVQLMGVCTVGEPMYIITELMVNGALLEYLRKDEGKTLSLIVLTDMAAQIADGMSYLEKQNFIHRDLRAANILVGENNTAKVADFGLARILETDDIYDGSNETKFPIKWTSPEAALDHKFSVKSDVWSYGVLLYEMITYGRMPYPGMDGFTTLEKLRDGYRMPRPQGRNFDCPPKMYEVMLKCWDAKPENRPTFAYLLTFFDDYATETEEHYHPPED